MTSTFFAETDLKNFIFSIYENLLARQGLPALSLHKFHHMFFLDASASENRKHWSFNQYSDYLSLLL